MTDSGDSWKELALRPFLVRMAKRAVKGEGVPASFSVPGLDYAAQGALERLLGVALRRTGDGRVCGRFPETWREPAAWREVALALGVAPPAAESLDTFWARLALLAPTAQSFIKCLSMTTEVTRFVRPVGNRAAWQKLFLGVVRDLCAGGAEPTTLSQLGSRWLNDSKALRTGALRHQLALMLTVLIGCDVDERTLFATYGIFDNPYTSFATFFAPVSFTTADGATFDFPRRLFAAGQACVLASETVSRIKTLTWHGASRVLTTSENAAPFAQYVASRVPALYTEGYPNYAVQRLLSFLGEAGVAAEHAGDADFDGFRIAGMVGKCLPVTRVVAAEVVRNPHGVAGIPLTDEQRRRAESFLTGFPSFPYAAEIRKLLARGCWYEQEAFPGTL